MSLLVMSGRTPYENKTRPRLGQTGRGAVGAGVGGVQEEEEAREETRPARGSEGEDEGCWLPRESGVCLCGSEEEWGRVEEEVVVVVVVEEEEERGVKRSRSKEAPGLALLRRGGASSGPSSSSLVSSSFLSSQCFWDSSSFSISTRSFSTSSFSRCASSSSWASLCLRVSAFSFSFSSVSDFSRMDLSRTGLGSQFSRFSTLQHQTAALVQLSLKHLPLVLLLQTLSLGDLSLQLRHLRLQLLLPALASLLALGHRRGPQLFLLPLPVLLALFLHAGQSALSLLKLLLQTGALGPACGRVFAGLSASCTPCSSAACLLITSSMARRTCSFSRLRSSSAFSHSRRFSSSRASCRRPFSASSCSRWPSSWERTRTRSTSVSMRRRSFSSSVSRRRRSWRSSASLCSAWVEGKPPHVAAAALALQLLLLVLAVALQGLALALQLLLQLVPLVPLLGHRKLLSGTLSPAFCLRDTPPTQLQLLLQVLGRVRRTRQKPSLSMCPSTSASALLARSLSALCSPFFSSSSLSSHLRRSSLRSASILRRTSSLSSFRAFTFFSHPSFSSRTALRFSSSTCSFSARSARTSSTRAPTLSKSSRSLFLFSSSSSSPPQLITLGLQVLDLRPGLLQLLAQPQALFLGRAQLGPGRLERLLCGLKLLLKLSPQLHLRLALPLLPLCPETLKIGLHLEVNIFPTHLGPNPLLLIQRLLELEKACPQHRPLPFMAGLHDDAVQLFLIYRVIPPLACSVSSWSSNRSTGSILGNSAAVPFTVEPGGPGGCAAAALPAAAAAAAPEAIAHPRQENFPERRSVIVGIIPPWTLSAISSAKITDQLLLASHLIPASLSYVDPSRLLAREQQQQQQQQRQGQQQQRDRLGGHIWRRGSPAVGVPPPAVRPVVAEVTHWQSIGDAPTDRPTVPSSSCC
ncbi:hypothetical protein CRUP_019234 [Coryphaenoides rupestris]|nr:hypothetical protein CRUP_019234 [Coryphaenoides rupestris]